MEKAQFTDQNQLRFNQSLLVATIPLAFALGLAWPVALLFVLMASHHLGFDALAWLKRSLGVRPRLTHEDPRPHRFARTVGAVFLGLATLAFGLEAWAVGWVLAFAVAALALLSLTTRVCVGCFLYFQLRMFQQRLSR
ncbi:hypothetical protein Mterra_02034 [Calidithermus terrae]|uniref:DUF4395 domain-containing protein n=1 Tax=Calidithermus terrae TaxID=1408545 RepID=A0A399EHV6_9DEIN|nr:DUF4395 domain-containing protein [Calidithermus terrae]RIH84237.1 hypothetical protein Mterra_02034 [Calidithermus terrae]